MLCVTLHAPDPSCLMPMSRFLELQIVYNMQNIFNLLPNLNVDELVRSMLVKTNDMHLVIYLSALIRSVVALHDLVNNKVGEAFFLH